MAKDRQIVKKLPLMAGRKCALVGRWETENGKKWEPMIALYLETPGEDYTPQEIPLHMDSAPSFKTEKVAVRWVKQTMGEAQKLAKCA